MAEPSLVEILPRLFLSMAIVIVVMYVAARVMKNRNVTMAGGTHLAIGAKTSSRRSPAPLVEVLGRQGVGKNASVSVVRTGGRTLVLGVTDNQVTLLTELEDAGDDAGESVHSPTTSPRLLSAPVTAGADHSGDVLKTILEQVREKTVRRTG